ncbi:MAG: hypothetical protein B7Z63_01360 [Ignavibacteriae bacterium 37-53-5]|nr:MAG: hypothetical protein B7Z63_01360 [Ignavibacteriae bacterium 37-53-5]
MDHENLRQTQPRESGTATLRSYETKSQETKTQIFVNGMLFPLDFLFHRQGTSDFLKLTHHRKMGIALF